MKRTQEEMMRCFGIGLVVTCLLGSSVAFGCAEHSETPLITFYDADSSSVPTVETVEEEADYLLVLLRLLEQSHPILKRFPSAKDAVRYLNADVVTPRQDVVGLFRLAPGTSQGDAQPCPLQWLNLQHKWRLKP